MFCAFPPFPNYSELHFQIVLITLEVELGLTPGHITKPLAPCQLNNSLESAAAAILVFAFVSYMQDGHQKRQINIYKAGKLLFFPIRK